jgi:hypothetical protein
MTRINRSSSASAAVQARRLPRVSRSLARAYRSASLTLATVIALSACASATPATGASPSPTPTSGGGVGAPTQVAGRWTVGTLPYVDLWLHAFAVLGPDTTPVPLFKRGYRDSLTALKRRANILTSLDANRDALARGLATNPSLVQAQFLALGFKSFAEIKDATDKFQQYQGQANRAPDAITQQAVAQLAAMFPTAADREWLRLFMAGVTDEQARFYDAAYARAVRERGSVLRAVTSLWENTYHRKFERFLTNTSQRNGEIVLSLPLGPEGRTTVGSDQQTIVAVPFPARVTEANEAILVLAHEVVGTLVSGVVADNITPAQQRNGEASNYIAFSQVQAGLLLLQQIAPELAEPYARYYLGQGGKAVPFSNAAVTLRSAFPVPQSVIDGLTRQIELVLGGI